VKCKRLHPSHLPVRVFIPERALLRRLEQWTESVLIDNFGGCLGKDLFHWPMIVSRPISLVCCRGIFQHGCLGPERFGWLQTSRLLKAS